MIRYEKIYHIIQKEVGKMSIFDEIGKKITNAGQETATKAKKFTEISKLNSLISEKEKENSNLFLEIGHSYYERHKDDASADEKVRQVIKNYEDIEIYKKQIGDLKGVEKCQNCGAEISNGAMFCNVCGAKISAVSAQVEKEEKCVQCGAKVGKADLFCNSCGAKITKE